VAWQNAPRILPAIGLPQRRRQFPQLRRSRAVVPPRGLELQRSSGETTQPRADQVDLPTKTGPAQVTPLALFWGRRDDAQEPVYGGADCWNLEGSGGWGFVSRDLPAAGDFSRDLLPLEGEVWWLGGLRGQAAAAA